MTFTLYYYISLALSYTIEVVVGSRNIIRIVESDFTDEHGFRNLIRVLEA